DDESQPPPNGDGGGQHTNSPPGPLQHTSPAAQAGAHVLPFGVHTPAGPGATQSLDLQHVLVVSLQQIRPGWHSVLPHFSQAKAFDAGSSAMPAAPRALRNTSPNALRRGCGRARMRATSSNSESIAFLLANFVDEAQDCVGALRDVALDDAVGVDQKRDRRGEDAKGSGDFPVLLD